VAITCDGERYQNDWFGVFIREAKICGFRECVNTLCTSSVFVASGKARHAIVWEN
jgi:hypothetical protein